MAAGMSPPAPDAVDVVLPGQELLQSSRESAGDPPEPGLSRYHLALQRMAGDLLSLRRRVASLEAENGHLRHSLARLREPAALHHTQPDKLSREELLERLATLGRELAVGAAEMRGLRDRVQRLQNELIRKNDREKELVLLQRWHRQQQVTLRRCQDRVAKARALEQALRQQEKASAGLGWRGGFGATGSSTGSLEWRWGHGDSGVPCSGDRGHGAAAAGEAGQEHGDTRGWGHGTRPAVPPRHPTGDRLGGDALALLPENRRLRGDPARAPRAPALPGRLGGEEKLRLLARLEEAQARGRVLERQLEEAARSWGRENQELGTRLLEREHGLPPARTLPAVPVPPRRRPQPLPPLP
ncbi:coiled-coil domain-containing protein 33 [Poecile atricapillus]|uniref:coiled-coil domain-containing protein 33 n=1 Tax=Poecile atricapillus TaxID=48891 RepID=UPI0027396217|nr:coiled-coil domain-containing protein 33 [Poecile atricapillus]